MTEDHHFATTDSGKNHPQVLKLVGKNLMKLFTYSQNISPHYWGYATLTKWSKLTLPVLGQIKITFPAMMYWEDTLWFCGISDKNALTESNHNRHFTKYFAYSFKKYEGQEHKERLRICFRLHET